MGLIELLVLITVVGVLMYFVQQFVPMEEKIKQLLTAVVVLVLVVMVIVWVAGFLGYPVRGALAR